MVENIEDEGEKKSSPSIGKNNVDGGTLDCFPQSIRADQLNFGILCHADQGHHCQTKKRPRGVKILAFNSMNPCLPKLEDDDYHVVTHQLDKLGLVRSLLPSFIVH